AATVEMPVPARTRDFRLTEEDARRLHPGGWRRLVGFLAGPRLAFTQPLAAGLTTIGLAGLLLFSLQGFGSSAAAPLSAPGNASTSTQERTQATNAPSGAPGSSAAASSASG